MRLLELSIRGLHGCYDYNVKFNPDITFLYGSNGCGKTTILNITEAIITGQIFKLFSYEFEVIELQYEGRSATDDGQTIRISRNNSRLDVIFKGKKYGMRILVPIGERATETRQQARYYFGEYEFLSKIKDTFNYVYLPLERSTTLPDNTYYDPEVRRYAGSTAFRHENRDARVVIDYAMRQVRELIQDNYARINSSISDISDSFRNEVLRSLLDVTKVSDLPGLFLCMTEESSVSNFQDTHTAYIKILKELSIITKDEENTYNKFFEDFIEEFAKYKEVQEGSDSVPINLFAKFQEISKIKSLVAIAEKMEQNKASARKPLELFLETMNDFIGKSGDKKEIKLDENGRIHFITQHSGRPIGIQCLSSGEKQLITFFANLIFNVKSDAGGIFVVDEPEVSLHLSWQKMFVEKVIGINNNVQVIFATHSPEIIGANRSKMCKLEKTYSNVGGKKS